MRNQADHPIHDLLTARWSPYGFAPRAVPADDLRSLFEAARWAASSFNEQPWRFIVATRENEVEFGLAVECLMEGNQGWAANAGAIVLCAISTEFSRNGKRNRVALHDLGLAVGNLTIEATSRGLVLHQMAGILSDKIREEYGVPAEFEPMTAIAIGYAADPADVPEDLRKRETGPRTRKPLGEIVFAGKWGEAAGLA